MNIPVQIEYMLKKLTDSGYEAYLVGGCVRDFLLGKTPDDYDITTSAFPEETMAVFASDKVVPTGLKHGTVTVLYSGMSAEITTYRTETAYTDGRHPDNVEFSRDIRDDLCRRDFTVNAMAMDFDGNIIDLYGGVRDFDNRIIRAVGEPSERFTEDALRILRAFRFASKLGFDIENKTLKAAISLAPRLSLVSRERIFIEFEKLICSMYYAGKILRIMYENKVLDCIFDKPQINIAALDYIDKIPPFAHTRFAALFLYDERINEHVKSLKPSNEFAASVKSIAECRLPSEYDVPTLRRLLSRYKDAAIDRATAENKGEIGNRLFEIFDTEDCFSVSDLDINGTDISNVTSRRGKEIGEALHTLLFAVFDGKVENRKSDLIEYLKRI
ncbi:MAG: CCA tRNA nucleotidyltransferase [Ruminococcaceae bacterium]|nr:CCA tRNA nucleotidyltransferase [Oscillospiraceae bacterium]